MLISLTTRRQCYTTYESRSLVLEVTKPLLKLTALQSHNQIGKLQRKVMTQHTHWSEFGPLSLVGEELAATHNNPRIPQRDYSFFAISPAEFTVKVKDKCVYVA